MKTTTTLLLLLTGLLFGYSQQVPLIKVGETEIGIAKLDVSVEVIGNIATTTFDMQFYNPTKEILEGELVFPLGENQSVSRFALDVLGKIREAVVVEKEQGRIAFEAVVRRRIDPAILEKGTGNNYRARIYPIPAKGYKRIILAYEEELKYTDDTHVLKVPLSFNKKLEAFNISIRVFDQDVKPRMLSGNLKDFDFQKKKAAYEAVVEKKEYAPADMVMEIPLRKEAKINTFQEYTYVYKALQENRIEKPLPKKIAILWDASYSMIERDLEKEFLLMDRYFKKLKDVEISVTTFSNTVLDNKRFFISNGKWDDLKAYLQTIEYDGGTSFLGLFESRQNLDEILLFTDGMNTLSDFPQHFELPVYIINSLQKANHEKNRIIVQEMGGSYLNLPEIADTEAFGKLTTNPLYFLGFNLLNPSLEVYPLPGTQVFNDFSVAFKGNLRGEQLELNFGYKGKVSECVTLIIPKEENGIDQVARIWAQKKLAQLEKDSEGNREAIVSLGKKYNLVTNHTSLIVLESVWDYVKYSIEPPAELMDEYRSIMKRNKEVRVVSGSNADNETEAIREVSENNNANRITGGQGTISGNVRDEAGPLPGVNVVVAGTTIGTQTDFDGNYIINAPIGSSLVFSYVGFATLESTVGGTGNINILMQEDSAQLDEVIVTGYGISREKKAIGYAVTTLGSEAIESKPETDVVRTLNGKVAGVQITGTSGATGSGTNFIIRSKSSINGDNQPLFVVDGVPFNTGSNFQTGFEEGSSIISNRALDLDPNNIQEIQVLKGLSASVLYGQAGRNGVVLITTKTGAAARNSFGNSSNNSLQKKIIKQKRAIENAKTFDEKANVANYVAELKLASSPDDVYNLYLIQREAYKHLPAYFVDVYDHMKSIDLILANRVLSNIPEIDVDNYELLKAFAYKLEEQGNYPLAVFIYRQILKLRTEDAQSYRDLALALQETGEIEEATGLLNSIATGTIYKGTQRRNFAGMQGIAINELRNLVHNTESSVSTEELPYKVAVNYDMDLRVVIDWNHNDTDIDLHIVDPNYEECSYKNPKTRIAGELSRDMTQGFGPEEFKQKFAKEGTYYIKVNYYGDRYQKIENPTFMKVTVYRDYGRKNQTKEIKVIRLSRNNKKELIGKIELAQL